MKNQNVKRKEGFSQVCVWPGTIIQDSRIDEFEKLLLDQLDSRVQYLETIETLPDVKDGELVEGTGGRLDVFFSVHEDDIGKFAISRLKLGIRWVEDVLGEWNGYDENPIYPERVKEYRTW